MSVTHSISTNSTSSSTHPNEQQIDPSNILYNDHQNYQIIFTNDSRFFDTSLHLFKSYCDLGYVKYDEKKPKKNVYVTPTTNALQPQSNGHNSRWRPKPTGFSSTHNKTLKPSFSRNNGHTVSQRSDPGTAKLITSKIKRDTSQVNVSHQRQRTPSNYSYTNGDTSDDPDIIITRL